MFTCAPPKYPLFWGEEEDAENVERYVTGGYHPVRLGDFFRSEIASYHVLQKLGRGTFSTVWLAGCVSSSESASPSSSLVALKICVAEADPQHELDVLGRLPHGEERHVISLLDSFMIHGPNGTHIVLVHDVLGTFRTNGLTKMVQKRPREVCKQIVQGVAFLHSHGVIHGDIHSDNLGIRLPRLETRSIEDVVSYFSTPEVSVVVTVAHAPHPEALPAYIVPPISMLECYLWLEKSSVVEPMHVEIMDLGNASIVGDSKASLPACTPAAVCAPEIMFQRVTAKEGAPSTFASDVWSLACTLYEVVLGVRVFYRASSTNNLLVEMAKLSGEVPQEWVAHWEATDQPQYLESIRGISKETADVEWERRLSGWMAVDGFSEFVELLRAMLKMDPSARPSAAEILSHPWFAGTDSG